MCVFKIYYHGHQFEFRQYMLLIVAYTHIHMRFYLPQDTIFNVVILDK